MGHRNPPGRPPTGPSLGRKGSALSTEIVSWRPSLDEVQLALTSTDQQLAVPDGLTLLDADQVQAAIASRILELDADAALGGAATAAPLDGQDLVDQGPLEITGGEFMPSGIKNGPGFYMLLTVRRLSDGSEALVSTGAHTVMSQLARRMCEGGPWPTPPVLWQQRDEPTPAGGRPQWLELAATAAGK